MTDTNFAALRAAGLQHDDPELVKLFDTSDPDWIAKGKVAKPALFRFDAMTASKEEVDRRMGEMDRDERRRRAERANAREMDRLTAQYGSP